MFILNMFKFENKNRNLNMYAYKYFALKFWENISCHNELKNWHVGQLALPEFDSPPEFDINTGNWQ